MLLTLLRNVYRLRVLTAFFLWPDLRWNGCWRTATTVGVNRRTGWLYLRTVAPYCVRLLPELITLLFATVSVFWTTCGGCVYRRNATAFMVDGQDVLCLCLSFMDARRGGWNVWTSSFYLACRCS